MAAAGTRTVRRIRDDEGPVLRVLRLAALGSDPLAFGSTLDREEGFSAEEWRDRATRGATSEREVIYVLTDEARPPHGMVGAFTEDGSRLLWEMWVAPSRRGEGGGEALLRAVLAWCRDHPGVKPVGLDVNPEQTAALRLYERHGFRRRGEARPLGHHPPAVRWAMELAAPPSTGIAGP
ncbi:MAG: GNAT family N-acetyltransferase [Thermoplasmata archaeon]|nr:GNAT family N-acetyltransferase [Thermoplasmata archaeon]